MPLPWVWRCSLEYQFFKQNNHACNKYKFSSNRMLERETTYLACKKSSLLKGLCVWPHLFRRPQPDWPPSPMPPLAPRGSKVKLSRWFRLIFLGPANWAGLNSARRVSATWNDREEYWSVNLTLWVFYFCHGYEYRTSSYFWCHEYSPPHVVLRL